MDARARAVLAGIVGAMTASVLHGLVDNSYFLVDLSIIFWLLVAYVVYSPAPGLDPAHTRDVGNKSVDAVV